MPEEEITLTDDQIMETAAPGGPIAVPGAGPDVGPIGPPDDADTINDIEDIPGDDADTADVNAPEPGNTIDTLDTDMTNAVEP